MAKRIKRKNDVEKTRKFETKDLKGKRTTSKESNNTSSKTMKIILRRYLTNSSPLVNGFPCMEYTISEKDYEKTRDEIGTKYNHECLTRGDTSTIS